MKYQANFDSYAILLYACATEYWYGEKFRFFS